MGADLRVWVWGSGFRVQGFGFRVLVGFWVLVFGLGLGFRVHVPIILHKQTDWKRLSTASFLHETV